MYPHRDFTRLSVPGQDETGLLDADSTPRPLRTRHNYVGSEPTQLPLRTNVDPTYTMGRYMDTIGQSPAWAPDIGGLTSASMQQEMVSTSYPFFMEGDFSPNEQSSSYPAQSNMGYGARYTEVSPTGPFHDNPGWMPSSQSSMLDSSPMSSGSRMFSGDSYSPISSLSNSSLRLFGEANNSDPSRWNLSGSDTHIELDIRTAGIGGNDWDGQSEYPFVTHDAQAEAATGEKGESQQLSDERLCCPVCFWTPQPHPSRTLKQKRQAVSKHRARRHSGKIFQCPARGCSTTFTRTDNIRPHVKREHPKYITSPVAPQKPGVRGRRSGNGSSSSTS